MSLRTSGSPRRWISLGEACQLLEVNESTLRQWADSGLVRAYRTPGGHRRFSAQALRALTERQHESAEKGRESRWTDRALQRVRRRLRGSQALSQPWHQVLDETSRSRMRLLGRRLLAIAADHAAQRRQRRDLLEEAQLIGEEHGAEMVRLGVPLKSALEAFVFFRSFLLEATLGSSGAALEDPTHLWRSVNLLADQVLVSMASCYDTTPTPPHEGTTAERN